MELLLRAALIAWLAADPNLAAQLNEVTEEAPLRTALPWLALSASAMVDWSHKDGEGAEIRIAFELHCRGDQPGSAADLVAAIQNCIASVPPAQAGYTIAGIHFLRSRVEQRGGNTRAMLLEYRFRTLAD